MANPAIGDVVLFFRADGQKFNALVLSDEGPGFIGLAYVDTTATPPFVTSATPVPVAQENANGVAIA